MKPRLLFSVCGFIATLAGVQGQIGFYSLPSNVDSDQSYLVGAYYEPPTSSGQLTVWKNNSWFSDTYYWGPMSIEAWTSDSGPATINYVAEGMEYQCGYVDYAYGSVQVSGPTNQPPVATVWR